MTPREFLDILHVAERLKDTPRHCTTTNRRTESVAEHSWRISLMALLLRGEFPEADVKTDADRDVEDSLLGRWVRSLPPEVSAELTALFREMDAQETVEAKIYKSLDKLEALIQHNESPLDTWSQNEYALNQVYAFDTVAFSTWLSDLRKEILNDTLAKMAGENPA